MGHVHIGLGLMSGSSYTGGVSPTTTSMTPPGNDLASRDKPRWWQRLQPVMPLMAGAPGSSQAVGAVTNLNNGILMPRLVTHLALDYSVINHVAHVVAAIKRSDTGAAANNKNTNHGAGIYDLAQNLALHAIYTHNSGSKYSQRL